MNLEYQLMVYYFMYKSQLVYFSLGHITLMPPQKQQQSGVFQRTDICHVACTNICLFVSYFWATGFIFVCLHLRLCI